MMRTSGSRNKRWPSNKKQLTSKQRNLPSGGWESTTEGTKDDQAMKEQLTLLPSAGWESTTKETKDD